MKIRPVTREDTDAVTQMGYAMHLESAYAELGFRHGQVAATVGEVVDSEWQSGFVAEKDGEVVGMVAGLIAAYEYGWALIAYDRLWYVIPDARGSSAAIRLLTAFELWAKAKGAAKIMMGQTTGVDPEGVKNLYRHLGYSHLGGNFAKDL